MKDHLTTGKIRQILKKGLHLMSGKKHKRKKKNAILNF